MPSIAIVDSGPLLAVANRRDPDHLRCLELLESSDHEFVIPALCVAEVAYLLGQRHGALVEAQFLRGLATMEIEAPDARDWERIADLVEQYSSLPLGGTDASVVALAERLDTCRIVTLDRRHFGVVKPRHCEAFELLPPGS
jgi:uncharacterized protein